MNLKDKRKVFKYNEEEILEMLTDYLKIVNELDDHSKSKSTILGTPGKDLRLVSVIGDVDDEEINDLHLEGIDCEVEYKETNTDLDDKLLYKFMDVKVLLN